MTISILGCGWLGLPLGHFFVNKGMTVKGSVTSVEGFSALQKHRVIPYQLLLSPELSGSNLEEFFTCDVLIVNFPPGRRPDIVAYHSAQINSLIGAIKYKVPKVLFVSSTSVYPDVNREVFEHENLEPAKGSGQALKEVENLLMQQKEFVTTVVRFGGLVGYNRLPGKWLASKTDVPNANAPVNIVHRDDCIEIIYQLIEQQVWGEIFNACADEHPLRKDYYKAAALILGLEPPVFADNKETGYKLVNSAKLKLRLSYTFKYPDPFEMLDTE